MDSLSPPDACCPGLAGFTSFSSFLLASGLCRCAGCLGGRPDWGSPVCGPLPVLTILMPIHRGSLLVFFSPFTLARSASCFQELALEYRARLLGVSTDSSNTVGCLWSTAFPGMLTCLFMLGEFRGSCSMSPERSETVRGRLGGRSDVSPPTEEVPIDESISWNCIESINYKCIQSGSR